MTFAARFIRKTQTAHKRRTITRFLKIIYSKETYLINKKLFYYVQLKNAPSYFTLKLHSRFRPLGGRVALNLDFI